MSYTIDIYRRKTTPERNFARFELYVLFFPQLVAGPIERTNSLLPQVNRPNYFNADRLGYGLKLMVVGFFTKIVIADNLSLIVTEVYSKPQSYFGWDIILATFFFAIQIYCDFVGYTNIARGAAHILGVDLMRNFQQPYFAVSIRDFWKRWHISLSTWFRDYLYLSLGGKRVIKWKWYYNILITFIISGFWHGANWTFIIWGAIHGLVYLVETVFRNYFKKNTNIIESINSKPLFLFSRIFVTFVIVCFSWIFFRSENVKDALILIQNIFQFKTILPVFSFDKKLLVVSFVMIFILFLIDKIETKVDIVHFVSQKNLVFRWSVYYIFILIIIGFGNWGLNEFIYFQF
jgi:D-alanyl-lipoteichoic acid acyltransferase DltB (MBOAT superfamily)